jgi:hypothetical protein
MKLGLEPWILGLCGDAHPTVPNIPGECHKPARAGQSQLVPSYRAAVQNFSATSVEGAFHDRNQDKLRHLMKSSVGKFYEAVPGLGGLASHHQNNQKRILNCFSFFL